MSGPNARRASEGSFRPFFLRLIPAARSRQNFSRRPAFKAVLHGSAEESSERRDVLPRTGGFECGHVVIAVFDGGHCLGVATGREHQIHQEASDAPVAVHVGMDTDVYEMARRARVSQQVLSIGSFTTSRVLKMAEGEAIRLE